MLDPSGRVVMVSGASRGIGLAIARTLHAKGYRVSAGARDVAALDKALADLDADRLLTARYQADDRDTHNAWLDATIARFGHLDGLVNNAGISNGFAIESGDEADLDAVWTVNVKGPLFLTRICLPHLKAAGSGRIVNLGSLSGKRVRNDNIAYNLSKFAMMALTHGTRRIGWDKGVRATALCPSFVATDLTADVTKVARADMIQPEDLAELAAMVIALPNSSSVAELLVNCRFEDTL